MRYNDGLIIGTGAARHVELGFVPSWVRIVKGQGSTPVVFEGPVAQVITFDGGGGSAADPKEIVAGMKVGVIDSWEGIVKQVVLASGSWAGGNAAGFIVFEEGTLTGAANIGDNNTIAVATQVDEPVSGDYGTVNGAGLDLLGVTVDAAVDDATAGESITPYYGSGADKSRGFTIGATISDDGVVMAYQAWAPDPGSAPVDMSRG